MVKQFANNQSLRQRALGSDSMLYDGVGMGDPQYFSIALDVRSCDAATVLSLAVKFMQTTHQIHGSPARSKRRYRDKPGRKIKTMEQLF